MISIIAVNTDTRLMMSIFVIFNRLLIRMILTMKWSK
ncbi:hypothetical protein IMSAGC007_00102 [Lachnospiraceae bacterium]|nr:hypothetical protein IMSAGC007_00102 [Lachnospiraceae bacterium]